MDFETKSDFQQMLSEEIWPEVSKITFVSKLATK